MKPTDNNLIDALNIGVHDGVDKGDYVLDLVAAVSLMTAAIAGDEEKIQLLLAAGAELDTRCLNGMTALMHAAQYDRVDCVNALLVAGADHALVNSDGQTAEDMAGDKTKPILTALREHELLKRVAGVDDQVQHYEPRRIM